MTTYIDAFPKPQQLHEMVQYLDKIQYDNNPPKNSTRLTEYKSLLADRKKQVDIMSKLLSESDLVFSKGNDAEIDSFWSLHSTLLTKLTGVSDLTQRVVHSIIKDTDKPKLRLAILNNMYNVFHEPSWRYPIFIAILEFALKTQNTQAVEGLFDNVDVRIKEWNCNPPQKAKIYDLILQHLQATEDGFDDEKFEFFCKFLSVCGPSDPGEILSEEVKERISATMLEIIKDPNCTRIDNILEFPVVSALKNDSKFTEIYQIFEIFAKFGYSQYNIYLQKNSSVIESLGLDKNELLTKIRLISFVSVAATKDLIPYAEVSALTGLPEDEVEMLVVEGITRGMCDARLDQKKHVIVIRHAEPRTYGQSDWKRMESRLAKWKANMSDVVQVIQSAKTLLASNS